MSKFTGVPGTYQECLPVQEKLKLEPFITKECANPNDILLDSTLKEGDFIDSRLRDYIQRAEDLIYEGNVETGANLLIARDEWIRRKNELIEVRNQRLSVKKGLTHPQILRAESQVENLLGVNYDPAKPEGARQMTIAVLRDLVSFQNPIDLPLGRKSDFNDMLGFEVFPQDRHEEPSISGFNPIARRLGFIRPTINPFKVISNFFNVREAARYVGDKDVFRRLRNELYSAVLRLPLSFTSMSKEEVQKFQGQLEEVYDVSYYMQYLYRYAFEFADSKEKYFDPAEGKLNVNFYRDFEYDLRRIPFASKEYVIGTIVNIYTVETSLPDLTRFRRAFFNEIDGVSKESVNKRRNELLANVSTFDNATNHENRGQLFKYLIALGFDDFEILRHFEIQVDKSRYLADDGVGSYKQEILVGFVSGRLLPNTSPDSRVVARIIKE